MKIKIFTIFIIIIFLFGISNKINFSEKFIGINDSAKNSQSTDNDWLEELFEYRQIITIPERIEHVEKFSDSFEIKPTIFNAILKKI